MRRLLLIVPLLLAAASASAKMGERVSFKSEDGWALAGDWAPGDGKRTVFILAHGGGGRRGEWEPLRRALWARGYSVLTFDFRGHGESVWGPDGSSATWRSFEQTGADNEWNRMTLDFDAAAKFLADQGVPLSSTAVVGSAIGANLALKWAAVHPEVREAVLLSPGINYKDVLSIGAMRAYGKRPILLIAGEDDRAILLATKLIYDNARYHTGEAFAQFWTVPGKEGARLLSPELSDRIVGWIASLAVAGADVQASTAPAVSSPTSPAPQ